MVIDYLVNKMDEKTKKAIKDYYGKKVLQVVTDLIEDIDGEKEVEDVREMLTAIKLRDGRGASISIIVDTMYDGGKE